MYCRNCGNEMHPEAVVCVKCGVPAGKGNSYCPNCGAETHPEAVICTSCGVPLGNVKAPRNTNIKPVDIIEALEKENIESRPIWKPMHMQPVFKKYEYFNHNDDGITVGEDLFSRGICLPSDTKNTDEDMERIISIIKNVF